MTTPRARLIVRYLPDAPKFTRLAVNDEYCRVFGVDRKNLVDASALSLISKGERRAVAEKLAGAVRTQTPLLSIDTSIAADGRRVRIRWMDIPVLDCSGSGRVVEMIGVGEVIE